MREGEKKQSVAEGAGESSKRVGSKKPQVRFSTPPKWRSRHSLSGRKYKKPVVAGRPALQTLQPHASKPSLLVGAGSPRLAAMGKPPKKTSKEQTKTVARRQENVKTSFRDKGVQTDPPPPEASIDYRMCTEEVPPVEYWQSLAEQRRLALAETLDENEQLVTEVEKLRSEVSDLQAQLQSKDYFAMMYKIAATDEHTTH